MNHRPFEDWIFAEEPLTPEEFTVLQDHLQTCAACRQLEDAWHEVSAELDRLPQTGPKEGFLLRWDARIEADIRQRHRRQSIGFLVISLSAVAALMILLLILVLPMLGSPLVLLWAGFSQLLLTYSALSSVRDLLFAALSITQDLVPPLAWPLMTGMAALLIASWLFVLRLILRPWRINE